MARFLLSHGFLLSHPSRDQYYPDSLGLRVVRDTRPNHFYPTGGSKLEFTADFFSQALGSKYSLRTTNPITTSTGA
jgi:hypothetical protein